MNMYNGFLIAIEGINGSGKSTLAKNLKEKLKSTNKNIVIMKEPHDPSIYDKLKSMTQSQAVAEFMAGRIEYRKEIINHLMDEDVVILDRFYWSTAILQSDEFYYPMDYLINLGRAIHVGIEPDAIIYIDVAPTTAYERVINLCSETNTERDINESLDKLYVAKSKYNKLVNMYKFETDNDDLYIWNQNNVSTCKSYMERICRRILNKSTNVEMVLKLERCKLDEVKMEDN